MLLYTVSGSALPSGPCVSYREGKPMQTLPCFECFSSNPHSTIHLIEHLMSCCAVRDVLARQALPRMFMSLVQAAKSAVVSIVDSIHYATVVAWWPQAVYDVIVTTLQISPSSDCF
jgi:hypothetical protein